ncbi:MAG: hypothetical protein ACJA1A_002782 [Saprospiraceae bacterium]|jgi:hypothetical protein|tara:strand:+ start:1578 stop:2057 length:480 start_codon:yes stop_codon:yes gene_type:complete
MNMLFSEKQKMSFWWLWVLLWVITLIPAYGIYKQIIIGVPFGGNPMSNTGLIIFLTVMLLILLLIWMIELKTEITEKYILVHFFPFFKTKYLWSEIESAEMVNYGFVGYGIRIGTKYGTVYNTRGNKGMAIQLKNDTKYCIGTQKESALQKVLEVINNK